MGTPSFAVKTLETILDSHHKVVGVVTAMDKPAGRGKKIKQSDVTVFSNEHSLNVLQPENLKDEQFVAQLEELKADLFVVVAFRMLPKVIWTIPPKGTINLHASLLPQLRGAAPINWAIMNGLKETGVTTFYINEVIDTGKIIDQRKVLIGENMNCGELHDVLKNEGAELYLKQSINFQEGVSKQWNKKPTFQQKRQKFSKKIAKLIGTTNRLIFTTKSEDYLLTQLLGAFFTTAKNKSNFNSNYWLQNLITNRLKVIASN